MNARQRVASFAACLGLGSGSSIAQPILPDAKHLSPRIHASLEAYLERARNEGRDSSTGLFNQGGIGSLGNDGALGPPQCLGGDIGSPELERIRDHILPVGVAEERLARPESEEALEVP
jgi:hypothetical protein